MEIVSIDSIQDSYTLLLPLSIQTNDMFYSLLVSNVDWSFFSCYA